MKSRKKKNPGKKTRKEEKEITDVKRGARIPLQKVVEDKKSKQKKRSRLKADLKTSIQNEE
jgi:hypothetical protein